MLCLSIFSYSSTLLVLQKRYHKGDLPQPGIIVIPADTETKYSDDMEPDGLFDILEWYSTIYSNSKLSLGTNRLVALNHPHTQVIVIKGDNL